MNERPRLERLWYRSDSWPLPFYLVCEPVLAKLCCLVYSHGEFLEMDNRSVCCYRCAKLIRQAQTFDRAPAQPTGEGESE